MLSEPQIKRLFAIAKSNGWSNDDLKRFLQYRYKIDSTGALTISNYDFLCSFITQVKPEEAFK